MIATTLALAFALAPTTGHDPVSICHSGNGTNYTYIEPDDNGLNGHQHHANDQFGLTEEECNALNPKPFTPYLAYSKWLIPETWDSTVTPYYTAAIFPQTPLTDFPCGRWSQDDTYLIASPSDEALYASLDDDGFLTQGEDSAIYQSHVFTYSGDCPPVEPEPEPTQEPEPAPEPSDIPSSTPVSNPLPELAETGNPSTLTLAYLAGGLLLVLAGSGAIAYTRTRNRREE